MFRWFNIIAKVVTSMLVGVVLRCRSGYGSLQRNGWEPLL